MESIFSLPPSSSPQLLEYHNPNILRMINIVYPQQLKSPINLADGSNLHRLFSPYLPLLPSSLTSPLLALLSSFLVPLYFMFSPPSLSVVLLVEALLVQLLTIMFDNLPPVMKYSP